MVLTRHGYATVLQATNLLTSSINVESSLADVGSRLGNRPRRGLYLSHRVIRYVHVQRIIQFLLLGQGLVKLVDGLSLQLYFSSVGASHLLNHLLVVRHLLPQLRVLCLDCVGALLVQHNFLDLSYNFLLTLIVLFTYLFQGLTQHFVLGQQLLVLYRQLVNLLVQLLGRELGLLQLRR